MIYLNLSEHEQESVINSEMRYRRLFESARDGILILDAETRKITDVNPFMVGFLGYTHEEFLGKELWEIGLLKDEVESIAAFTELQEKEYIRYEDLPLKTKNGEHREVEFISNVYSEAGRLVIQCNIRDNSEHKALLKKLLNSEARLANAQRLANLGNWELDLINDQLFWSDEILEIFGISEDQFEGNYDAFASRVYPEDSELVQTAVEKAIAGIAPCNFEHRIIRPNGEERTVWEIGEVIFDSSGIPTWLIGTVQDITDRKRAEETIQISETRFRQLVESSIIGIITTNLNGIVIDANDVFLKMVGYGRDELLAGKVRWDEMTPEEYRVENERIEITEFGATKPHEKEYIRKDGIRIPVLVGGTLLEGSKDEIIAFVLDMSEQKRTQLNLRKAEANYRNLIESSPGIVYLNKPNPPYSTIYVSPNINTIGYSPEEWYQNPDMWRNIIYKEDRERVLHEFENAISQGLETDLKYRITARDGSIFWWQDKGRFVTDEQGNRTGWQGIILDITSTKGLEHQLRQAQKLESVGLLAGGIAHDFNNMLTAINGYSDLAIRKMEENNPIREYIEEIKKAGLRSAALTQQLLAFSRQQVLQPILIDLNEIITDTSKMLQRLIGEHIQLTTTLNPKASLVKVDPGQFSQILMNLAVNARDAMPRGGKLTIETSDMFIDTLYIRRNVSIEPGTYVLFTVSDNGSGMSAEISQHIFEPFFTTKEVGQGIGLGLATVYGIVKQSGGEIEVYSEEGIGTTFKIYLPREATEAKSTDPDKKTAELQIGTEIILLVEDEELVSNLTKEILETCGYTIIVAQNGVEALEIFDKGDHKFDLLMTDVVMPQMGGRELADKLIARQPNLQILYTSGYTDDAIVRHGVIEVNTNFIQKPFSFDTLTAKVRQLLNNRILTSE